MTEMTLAEMADDLQYILDGERPRLNRSEMAEYVASLRAALAAQPADSGRVKLEALAKQADAAFNLGGERHMANTLEILADELTKLSADPSALAAQGESMRDWSLRMAEKETGQYIGAGAHGLAARGQGQGQGAEDLAGYVDTEQVADMQRNGGGVLIGSFSERYGRTVPVYFHPAPPIDAPDSKR